MGSRKTNKRVTMMDVAKAAGCSQATVSVVLNSVTDIKISSDESVFIAGALQPRNCGADASASSWISLRRRRRR